MLLLYGDQTAKSDWKVQENSPPLFTRVYYVRSGDVTYYDSKREEKLLHGHLYIFPTNSTYRMSQKPENPLVCLFFHIDILPHRVEELKKIKVCENSFLSNFLETAHYAMQEETETWFSILSYLCDSIVLFFIQQDIIKDANIKLADVVMYISDNIEHNISITKLSQICGYNPQYFIRLFSKTMGITPHQYIINIRLRESARLLQGNDSILKISSKVGYIDTKTFSRAFHNHFGVSPSSYRKYFQIIP